MTGMTRGVNCYRHDLYSLREPRYHRNMSLQGECGMGSGARNTTRCFTKEIGPGAVVSENKPRRMEIGFSTTEGVA